MNTAREIQEEIHPDEIDERLAVVEEMLADKKVKLPDDVFANALEGLENIREKLEKRLPVYEKDFEFIEELKWNVKIISKYNEAMENLKGGDLYNPEKPVEGDKKAPTRKEVVRTLATKLTMDQKDVIFKMKKPMLLIKPITTVVRFVWNLKAERDFPLMVARDRVEKNEKADGITNVITGWEVGFAEGAEEIDRNYKDLSVEKLINEWQNGPLAKKGAKIITFNEYMLLMKNSIKEGTPIDKTNASILREDGREKIDDGHNMFSYGWFGEDKGNNNGVRFEMQLTLLNHPKVRCRYAVMIKI